MRDNDLRRHGNRLLEGRHHEYTCLQMELMKVSCIRYPDVRKWIPAQRTPRKQAARIHFINKKQCNPMVNLFLW